MLQQKVEEGFRVLTLMTEVDKEVLDFIKQYQVIASHLYWAKKAWDKTLRCRSPESKGEY